MNTWERIKKVVKPHQIILLIILITSNTFAWFIYATKVDNTMSAHVRAWEVLFESGDSPVVDYINLTIENMYPGMDDYHYELKAYNKSEVGAVIKYEVLSANILGDEYYTKEGKADNQVDTNVDDITSDELIEKLKNYYPFKFNFNVSSTAMDAEVGEANYTVDASWPFESGDDELDTKWGNLAYNYKKKYPNNPSINIRVKVYISQANEA